MSYYAVLDNANETCGDVATISGWAAFGEWVGSLDSDATELRNLTNFGWSQELDTLSADLRAAIREGGDSNSLDIATNLLAMINERADAEVITVTDGVGVMR